MTYKQKGGYFLEVNGHPVKAQSAKMEHTTWIPGGPVGIIFHYTVGCSNDIIGTLESNGFGGAHFNVGLDGSIHQYAPLTVATWHCFGESHSFYGIEHTAYPGHGCELNDRQLLVSTKLSAALVEFMGKHYGNKVPLLHRQGSPYLTAGFRNHRDLLGDGYNSHTDGLYHWSWTKYLKEVKANLP